MNSIHTLPYSSSPRYFFTHNSFSVKRRRSRHSRRHSTTKTFEINPDKRSLANDHVNDTQSLKLVVDVNQISSLTSSRFHRFVSLAEDAYYDLKTLITVDENNRILFSCRKSTLQFTGALLLCGFVLVSTIRVLIKLLLGFRSRLRVPRQNVVVRRDRSLGGREVVVATTVNDRGHVKRKSSRVLDNPLSLPGWVFGSELGRDDWRSYRVRSQAKLPKWWPVSVAAEQDLVVDKQEYQREANRLIRAITDYKTSGKDVTEHDIIQLRRICRTSGVQVSFDTTNTRDSFYRASVDYVLKVCSSAPSYHNVIQIDGEDAQRFIAGLAENIGLENIRAARMVSAAVAARTRSCFLQAWALEVQGKHSEAVLELSKICLVLRAFPPEESSPEMEMVARGLGKHLKVEQRELLMDMYVSVCSEESHRSAADALGLMLSPRGVGDQHDSKHT
ncbi:hypothetical protein P3X46_000582 [Hevea brasiliensis]|uniref:Uncharacterized protein n=1 Tax=Hevea brasiliensis TaxID=3981 RepID=A0ABQ9NC39_HEVBR|nr:uncharacterized protein LOC131179159 [Hevea brasiliensis]KAJ9189267.1 hypothetical protein P3X46_000582 [Hevea brasiliensis]